MFEADLWIIRFLNSFALKYQLLDFTMVAFTRFTSLKMLPIMAVYWWMWFSDAVQRRPNTRHLAVCGLIGGFTAFFFSRLIQNFMDEIPRPVYNENLHFILPLGSLGNIGKDWSSFPSDTAAMAFALSTAIWLRSKQLGIATFIWSIFAVSLSRIYGGYHYPTNIIDAPILAVSCTNVLFKLPTTHNDSDLLDYMSET